ncbi:MAG: superoxide dismutase [Pyrinomonadaceae bacterium]
MNKITRREAITGIIAASAATLSLSENSFAQPETPGRAFRGGHQPKPLPFDAAKLKGISEKLIKSHWENNYGGSVGALNVVEKRLAQLVKEKDAPAYLYGDLKREELIRTGSVVLHEKYFDNLGGSGKADGQVLKLIQQWFGSYESWENEFRKTAQSLAGGSGWATLAYNLHTNEVHNYWASDHGYNAPLSVPLLVLDMYEHSYQMDYGAAAAKYVDAFMQNVNWDEVNRRVETTLKMSV